MRQHKRMEKVRGRREKGDQKSLQTEDVSKHSKYFRLSERKKDNVRIMVCTTDLMLSEGFYFTTLITHGVL